MQRLITDFDLLKFKACYFFIFPVSGNYNQRNKRKVGVYGAQQTSYERSGKNKYIESRSKAETSELAAFAGVTPTKIRQWKSADKCNELLTQFMKPNRGGRYCNKNAAGHGAPLVVLDT